MDDTNDKSDWCYCSVHQLLWWRLRGGHQIIWWRFVYSVVHSPLPHSWVLKGAGCEGVNWLQLAQNKRRVLVRGVKNLRGSIKEGEFLDNLRDCQLV